MGFHHTVVECNHMIEATRPHIVVVDKRSNGYRRVNTRRYESM